MVCLYKIYSTHTFKHNFDNLHFINISLKNSACKMGRAICGSYKSHMRPPDGCSKKNMRPPDTTLKTIIRICHCNMNVGVAWTASYPAVGHGFGTRGRLFHFYFHVLTGGPHVS